MSVAARGFGVDGLSPLATFAALASGAAACVPSGVDGWADSAEALGGALGSGTALGGGAEPSGTTALSGSAMFIGGVCTVR